MIFLSSSPQCDLCSCIQTLSIVAAGVCILCSPTQRPLGHWGLWCVINMKARVDIMWIVCVCVWLCVCVCVCVCVRACMRGKAWGYNFSSGWLATLVWLLSYMLFNCRYAFSRPIFCLFFFTTAVIYIYKTETVNSHALSLGIIIEEKNKQFCNNWH